MCFLRSRVYYFSVVVFLVLFAAPMRVLSQDGPPVSGVDESANVAKEEEKVVPGVISSSGAFLRSTSVKATSGGSAPGDDAGLISGSIQRGKNNSCVATLTNSSKENTMSVNYKVVGIDKEGRKALSRGYSAVIAPQESVSQKVTGCSSDLNVQIEVVSGKKR